MSQSRLRMLGRIPTTCPPGEDPLIHTMKVAWNAQ